MSLATLIERGPNPEKGMQALVLKNYQDILAARQLLWGWVDIARELDIEKQANSLRRSFMRVHGKVEKGILKPGRENSRAKAAGRTNAGAAQPPTEKRPLPGQQIPVGDGDAMNAALAAKNLVFK
ncbi:hypothetical protein HF289_08695 [Acidithiobacillus ferrooxidans]|uniref:hypothetical protein n=1 Tax=Acidithiobacillus ferrooxidans TaxID=920 RepID=UPI001C066AE6|nr:hypothetical protein [Acidithiobacillus ferrooxidans]MBU2856948.1 hypothetical protein [Acidithiobacillus ferrooxidans]